MKLSAFAKINLSLQVFEGRQDGFHEIESVMQSVSLCDFLTLTPINSAVMVTCDNPNVPQGSENLAYKAASLFLASLSSRNVEPMIGVKIHIEKRIPMAAGLAGGSADAAAVLYGLNQMTKAECKMTNDELIQLGVQIGSDVPFCLTGGTCLVKGRGEIVTQLAPLPKTYFVLVCPDFMVSSKWAYDEFDRMHLRGSSSIKNDLEPVVVSAHEEIAGLKEKLMKSGCSETQMSGSGPSVFGIAKHKADAEEIFSKIKESYSRSFIIETVDQGVK